MADLTEAQKLQAAIAHHQAGHLVQAEALYRDILTRDPRCIAALHYLGVIALQVGKHQAAVDLIRQAATLAPDDPEISANLGEAYRQLRRLDEAIACFRRALEINPQAAKTHGSLGNALRDKGRFVEAAASYQRALALNPDLVEVHNNLGSISLNQGRFDEAMASFRQAIALNPSLPGAHHNLGNVLKFRGRLDEAAASYRQALALKPDLAESHSNLGGVFKDRGELDEAIRSHRRAIALAPNRPDFHSNLILALQYHSDDQAGVIDPELRSWNERHAKPLARFREPHPNDRSPDRRLRIGYVSPDFQDHAIGLNLLPLFEHHTHRNLEIFCYAHVPKPDHVTARLRAGADHWRDITPFSNADLANLIRRDQIDILVDLSLHSGRNRLPAFARKPAPIQVSFAGYPGGTKIDAIDYHLTDPFLEPGSNDDSPGPDRPFRLAASFWCFEPPKFADGPTNPLPALDNGRITFGCLNNFCKVTEHTLRLWAQVMSAVPGSHLLMLTGEGSHRQRVADLLAKAGVSSNRIAFVGRQSRAKYFALYRNIDLSLDTFPYNGHTTSLDSYWMGVPVVTLIGNTAVGRAGWSQLSNLGLTELVARLPEEYVRIVSALALDRPRLGALRASLRERMRASPLMDGVRFAHDIEAAYRTMWHRWCAQATPVSAP